VVLQAVYNQSYLNGARLRRSASNEATPDPRGRQDRQGPGRRPTGWCARRGGVAFVAANIPLPDKEQWVAKRAQVRGRAERGWASPPGTTPAGAVVNEKHYEAYKALADRGELNAARVLDHHPPARDGGASGQVLRESSSTRRSRAATISRTSAGANRFIRPRPRICCGTTSWSGPKTCAKCAASRTRLPRRHVLNAHVEMENAIDRVSDEYEAVNKVEPIKGLRWASRTLDQVTDCSSRD